MSVEEVEKLRKKARNILLIGLFINIVIAVVLFYLVRMPFLSFLTFFVGIFIINFILKKPARNFILAFKEAFVLKSLKSVFTDLDYKPEKGLNESIIMNTGMMKMGDRYTSNDYVSGKYKNINVVQADVHIEDERQYTDSDGNTTTYWVTLFRGRWMIFDFNKKFKANIQVRHKSFENSKLGNWWDDVKYQKVMMEDQEFNNTFKIYAQNEHDAFYILTPALMEKIKKLTASVSGKLLFCFIDNKLHVGLQNNKDSFEHGFLIKINEEKVMDEISKDIKLITNFVDELSLDNDLFRREV